MQGRPRVGLEGELVAELTKLGWVYSSLGNRIKVTNLLFCKRSLHNYENLFRLGCFGIQENHVNSDDLVYDIFRIQLARKSL